MDIKTIGDLAKLADLCRKKGIKQIKVTSNGIELELGDKPNKNRLAKGSDKIDTPPQYSEEDLLYWSSSGIAEQH